MKIYQRKIALPCLKLDRQKIKELFKLIQNPQAPEKMDIKSARQSAEGITAYLSQPYVSVIISVDLEDHKISEDNAEKFFAQCPSKIDNLSISYIDSRVNTEKKTDKNYYDVHLNFDSEGKSNSMTVTSQSKFIMEGKIKEIFDYLQNSKTWYWFLYRNVNFESANSLISVIALMSFIFGAILLSNSNYSGILLLVSGALTSYLAKKFEKGDLTPFFTGIITEEGNYAERSFWVNTIIGVITLFFLIFSVVLQLMT